MKEKINIKKRILVSFLILMLTYSIYGVVYATLTKIDPTRILEGFGVGTVGGWYGVSCQNTATVFCSNNSRWYTVNPEFNSGVSKMEANYYYSDSEDYETWNDGGGIPDSGWILYICESGGVGEYPYGSLIAITYTNITNMMYSTWFSSSTYHRVGIVHGNITGGGSIDWSVSYICTEDYISCHLDIITDKVTGYPIIAISGYNDTASKFMTSVTFGNSKYPQNNEMDIIILDSLPEGERYCSVVSTGEKEAFILEGDGQNENKLYGGFVNNETYNWGAMGNWTDESVKIWQDTNNKRLMDWSLSYDNDTIYVTYTDIYYDLRYFEIDIETEVKSEEVILLNGNSDLTPYQPSITVNDYTSSITWWNRTSANNLYGFVMELDNESSWSTPLSLYNSTWAVGDFNPLSSCRISPDENSCVNMATDNDMYGIFFGFEGYGYSENGNGNGEERPDPFDWGNIKYMLALVVFFIIIVFAIYIKKSVR